MDPQMGLQIEIQRELLPTELALIRFLALKTKRIKYELNFTV